MLIDSPVFTRVRLQLLSPGKYPDLMRSMYSLLMLCPQSNSFNTLHARLSSVPTLALLKLNNNARQDMDAFIDGVAVRSHDSMSGEAPAPIARLNGGADEGAANGELSGRGTDDGTEHGGNSGRPGSSSGSIDGVLRWREMLQVRFALHVVLRITTCP